MVVAVVAVGKLEALLFGTIGAVLDFDIFLSRTNTSSHSITTDLSR